MGIEFAGCDSGNFFFLINRDKARFSSLFLFLPDEIALKRLHWTKMWSFSIWSAMKGRLPHTPTNPYFIVFFMSHITLYFPLRVGFIILAIFHQVWEPLCSPFFSCVRFLIHDCTQRTRYLLFFNIGLWKSMADSEKKAVQSIFVAANFMNFLRYQWLFKKLTL